MTKKIVITDFIIILVYLDTHHCTDHQRLDTVHAIIPTLSTGGFSPSPYVPSNHSETKCAK